MSLTQLMAVVGGAALSFGVVAGEDHFGPISQVLVSGLEGALFVTCIVGGMALRNSDPQPAHLGRATNISAFMKDQGRSSQNV